MVDIHTHILPGVDDGAATFEEAVAMVEVAASDGTTCMVATPHCNDRYPYSVEQNRKLLAELAAAVGGRMELALGCDFHLSYQNLQAVLGGMVSTNHASLVCPDWPTCNGEWWPHMVGRVALQMGHRP